jgi:Fe-S oxidoreductase
VPGPAAEAVAARTRDLFEYLAGRQREGTLVTDFPGRRPGKVAYQMPCHLRAQNMGYKTRDVLQLIPDTRVTVVERCTAMDGTWAMKKELPHQPGVRAEGGRDGGARARHLRHRLLDGRPSNRGGARREARPPATLLREAYGLPEERRRLRAKRA